MAFLSIQRSAANVEPRDLENAVWSNTAATSVDKYWNGANAAAERKFTSRLLWSDNAFFIRFDARVSEPIVVSQSPDVGSKSIGLWDRDVCEIFIAPDRNEPRKYFEFEIAPTGEWLDLAIDSTTGERVTDWDYRSGMEVAAKIEDHRVIMVIRIPWDAFGKKPKAGDVWLGNIFRCVGNDPDRGYLAWQPTLTEKPNFHVPERFGEFRFVK